MTEKTRQKLKIAQDFCDENDKSTEYMLQFMQDFANVDLDCVMNFLEEQHENKKNYEKF